MPATNPNNVVEKREIFVASEGLFSGRKSPSAIMAKSLGAIGRLGHQAGAEKGVGKRSKNALPVGEGYFASRSASILPSEHGRRFCRADQFIAFRQAVEVINAATFAATTPYPINCHLTLELTKSGLLEKLGLDAFRDKLADGLREFLRRQDVPFSAVWAVQNASGRKGVHLHLALHCPDAWRPWLCAAACRLAEVEPGGGFAKATRSNFSAENESLRGLLAYLLKGVSADFAEKLGIECEEQENISGKLCGSARPIGPQARAKAGWVERRTLPWLAAAVKRRRVSQEDVARGLGLPDMPAPPKRGPGRPRITDRPRG